MPRFFQQTHELTFLLRRHTSKYRIFKQRFFHSIFIPKCGRIGIPIRITDSRLRCHPRYRQRVISRNDFHLHPLLGKIRKCLFRRFPDRIDNTKKTEGHDPLFQWFSTTFSVINPKCEHPCSVFRQFLKLSFIRFVSFF